MIAARAKEKQPFEAAKAAYAAAEESRKNYRSAAAEAADKKADLDTAFNKLQRIRAWVDSAREKRRSLKELSKMPRQQKIRLE